MEATSNHVSSGEVELLFIHNDVVQDVLDMETCIRSQEQAFLEVHNGRAIVRPRSDIYVPSEEAPDGYYRWGSMEGASSGFMAIRMKSDLMRWPVGAAGQKVSVKYCREPGSYCGLIFLLSTRNGEPLAIINDGLLQQYRVGGGAGIGAKFMSRKDSAVLGLLGSSGMARSYLKAMCHVRPIEKVKVFSPTPGHREAFATEMSQEAGIEVLAVPSAREAVAGVDIVATATNSHGPTFDAEWLRPGMHVANAGWLEVSKAAAARFDRLCARGPVGEVFVSSEAAYNSFICGSEEEQSRLPVKELKENPLQAFKGIAVELPDVMEGRAEGRSSRDEITFFHNSGNQGVQFSAVGGALYTICKARGLGREIPTDWFLQDIRD